MRGKDNTPRWRPFVFDAAVIVLAAVVGLSVASAIVRTPVIVGPLSMSARLTWGWPGETTLRVPPFGTASAHTHAGPARLVVTVESVDLPGVERLLSVGDAPEGDVPTFRATATSTTAAVTDVVERRRRTAGQDIAALVLLSALASSVIAFLVAMAVIRRWRVVLGAAGLTFAFVVASSLGAASTFDSGALAEPRLEGALASVPRLASVFSARVASIERLRDQAAVVSDQLAAYYANPRSIAAGGGLPGTYRVLHVSDLHLDPVGAELERSLARSYETSLVINTGDISITGAAEEALLLPTLVPTATPTIYVAGNHDSTATLAALAQLPQVTIAGTRTITFDGLSIKPLPDPQADTPDIEPDRARVSSAVGEALSVLEAEKIAGGRMPDIIATHDPRHERSLVGYAPLLLSGHTHSARLYVSRGTVRLNSGTLGGMPYDPEATQRATLPHSASVLYYTADLPRRLIAIDTISVSADRTTTMTRHVVNESLLPTETATR